MRRRATWGMLQTALPMEQVTFSSIGLWARCLRGVSIHHQVGALLDVADVDLSVSVLDGCPVLLQLNQQQQLHWLLVRGQA